MMAEIIVSLMVVAPLIVILWVVAFLIVKDLRDNNF